MRRGLLMESMCEAPISGGFRMEGYWVWCGSVVKGEDGRFHMFASRWPKSLPMHPGWLVASEIVRATADTPEGPYEFQEVVLPARGAEYWDGRSTHNPHIVKHGSHYLLYYMGSTHPFGDPATDIGLDDPHTIVARANKRIGLAVADSVFGPWKRMDEPLLPTRPGKYDSFLTSNPAPCVKEDGSVLLIYKARRYEGHQHGKMTIGAAVADHWSGPYRVISDEPIFLPDSFHIEDPYIWHTAEGYELIAKDMDGTLCGEKHGGIHALSRDGLHWELSSAPHAYSRTISWDDGTVRTMGSLERPFLLFQDGKPTHLFAATADGPGGFDRAERTWNMVIPLA
ncbi:glycoside hydrolase family protein [Paenibacillus sp. J5C_2022]|uniref:glycoside hydrolase family protein n=1 Tax=Paenibacillus sp. J5C2022 TaxID=2977129 RepID=UPI0021CF22FD|nr:glycoside hydrolase family protein [Paenibacillus sp. J5C2022]MCU6707515.1 glycoside hydrolase family protein [Paenibacillus sp. J5C2022]